MSAYNNKLPPGAKPEKRYSPSGDVVVHMPHNRQFYFNTRKKTVDPIEEKKIINNLKFNIKNALDFNVKNMMTNRPEKVT